MTAPTNGDDYEAAGPAYADAFVLLRARCEIPPSLEVFQHELKERRRTDPHTPRELAGRLAANYRRIPI